MTGPPSLTDDLAELIGLFQSHHVEFLVVGAHALALYGRPRFTEDLDLFVNRTRNNAAKVRQALQEFGIGLTEAAERKLAEDPRAMLVIGNKPNQVDILNFLDGVEFSEALPRGQVGRLGPIEVPFIGLSDLIATKRAAGRSRDVEDLRQLREQLGDDFPG